MDKIGKRLSGRLVLLLLQLLFNFERFNAEAAVARGQQPGINATIMFNGANTVGSEAERDALAEQF
jgi:hypothetical protein